MGNHQGGPPIGAGGNDGGHEPIPKPGQQQQTPHDASIEAQLQKKDGERADLQGQTIAGPEKNLHGRTGQLHDYQMQTSSTDVVRPVNVRTPNGEQHAMTMSKGSDGRPVYTSQDGTTYRQQGRNLVQVDNAGKPVDNGNTIAVGRMDTGRHPWNDGAPGTRPERPQRPERQQQQDQVDPQKAANKPNPGRVDQGDGPGGPGGPGRRNLPNDGGGPRPEFPPGGKPFGGKPDIDGRPGGKPGDGPLGKPGDGKPGEGKPGEGKPGDGKPGDPLGGKPTGPKLEIGPDGKPIIKPDGIGPLLEKLAGKDLPGGKPGLEGKPHIDELRDKLQDKGLDRHHDRLPIRTELPLGTDPVTLNRIQLLLDRFQDKEGGGVGLRIREIFTRNNETLQEMKDFLANRGKDRSESSLSPKAEGGLRELIALLRGDRVTEGSATKTLLDTLQKGERPLDRIPTMEQTKALLQDITRQMMGKDGSLTDMISRSFGDKSDKGLIAETKPGEFILKINATDTVMQDLINRLKVDKPLDAGKPMTEKVAEAIIKTTLEPLDPNSALVTKDNIAGKTAQAAADMAMMLNAPTEKPQDKPSDANLAALKQKELDDKEELEAKKKQEELLAAMQLEKKRKEQEEKEKREKAEEEERQKALLLLQQKGRQRYRVVEGDTVSGISKKFFQDDSVAGLIFAINRGLIPLKMNKGKKFAVPKAGTVINIPGEAEVLQFRRGRSPYQVPKDIDYGQMMFSDGKEELAATFGEGWAGGAPETNSDKARAAAEKRNERTQRVMSLLGPASSTPPAADTHIKYNVRLGDTLRTIAMKHPALLDVKLWKLVAQINDLSTDTDFQGVPYVEVKRGSVLKLPLPTEIAEFRKEMEQRAAMFEHHSNGYVEMKLKLCEACHQPNLATAVVCTVPSCKHSLTAFDSGVASTSHAASSGGAATAVATRPVETKTVQLQEPPMPSSADALGGGGPSIRKAKVSEPPPTTEMPAPAAAAAPPEVQKPSQVFPISSTTRMTMVGAFDNLDDGVTIQLETLIEKAWRPVVAYEFLEYGCTRHVYHRDGGRRTRPVNLPLQQAQQLASTDLEQNWSTYCDHFQKGEGGD